MSKQAETRRLVDLPSDQPLILAGEPGSLRANVPLRNRGKEPLLLRDGVVSLSMAEGQKPRAFPVALSVTLPPARPQRVRLTLELDPLTPPGRYRGELTLGGSRHPLILHVVESVRLQVSPAALVIAAPAGEPVEKGVVLANDGNVPLRIGPLGPVTLGEELYAPRLRHAAVTPVESGVEKLVELFAEVVDEGGSGPALRPAGELDLELADGPLTLQPGEVRSLRLIVRPPESLRPNRRYRARLFLYLSHLDFVVVPAAEPIE